MNQSIKDLRSFIQIAFWEGISFLVLLFVAMPLKYYGDMPEAVRYTGMIHGILFVAFCVLLFKVWKGLKWPFTKALVAFIASLIPFGTFFLDAKLKKEYPEVKAGKSA